MDILTPLKVSRFDLQQRRRMTVIVRDGDVARALRALKKKLAKDHFIAMLKRYEAHEKPSEAHRRKARQSEKRRAKAAKLAAKQATQATRHTTRREAV